MKNKLLLFLLCFCCISIQNFAQTVKSQAAVSNTFTTILTTDDVTISVKVKPGENTSGDIPHGVTIYWQIRNKINKPVFLEGTYNAYGSPLNGYNRNKEGGTLPSSKVEPFKTGIFTTYAEQLSTTSSISIELTHIYKKSDVTSGNGI